MADNTKIEWSDATWNPITGCSIVSPGCKNCYAMQLAGSRLKNHPSREGLTKQVNGHHVWTGEVRFNEQWLTQPLKWTRSRMIFVCAHGDLFAEGVPDEWIDQVFAVMALCPQHVFQVLTKRPERMRDYFTRFARDFTPHLRVIEQARRISGKLWNMTEWPLRNVWLGVSVEDQKRADERLPVLLETPAAIRWISAEPLLGPLDILRHLEVGHLDSELGLSNPGIDWVVVGGESGQHARPLHPDWARSLRDQCASADVAFLFKQWGEYLPAIDRDRDDPGWRRDYSVTYADDRPDMAWLNLDGGSGFHGARFHVMQRVGKRTAGRLLDGVVHNAFPQPISTAPIQGDSPSRDVPRALRSEGEADSARRS